MVEKLEKQQEEKLTAMEKRVEKLEKENGNGLLSEGRCLLKATSFCFVGD